ncbi:MAG: hypothetical protein JRG73_10115 [Deltaproteobacteria bacterium]|nr:hypothetical protein [Deltaproteobacteria bacterium]MBW2307279.1 hypothetical protein [Deltaproteobacteria bacterium]
MKTIDAHQTEIFHGVHRAVNGTRAVFSSMMRQPGTNIGLNQHGLAVTMSYSDYRAQDAHDKKEIPRLENDSRALANAEILANCATVDEGLRALEVFVPRHPHQVGGNHLVIDADGGIALLEQCAGKYQYNTFTNRGYCGRGNNSHWLIKDKQSNSIVPVDSLPREEAMENFLKDVYENIPKGMSVEEIVNNAKLLLSRHAERTDQTGAICAHGLTQPGARLFGDNPCYTLTAVIIDIKDRIMHFSLGSPCAGNWKTLKLE